MCRKLLTRWGLELPTEAEWEYGCRAGTSWPWWTGAERGSLQGAANLANQTAAAKAARRNIKEWSEQEDGYVLHAPVDALRANAWGLHHVHGNLWEWCRDLYGRSYDSRVSRGGGFLYAARFARASNRSNNTPDAP
jgi:formylglycine-generating enzyme required for sulfatase activity